MDDNKAGGMTMYLYHTSKVIIKKPDIYYGRLNADFGQGFYLTTDKEFAYRWARKDSYINEYEFDITGLDVYTFNRNKDWVEYVFNNRHVKDSLDVDVVMGPIANDTIFDTLGIISSGLLESEQMLKLLLIGPEYTQVALKSEKAADRLRWIDAKKVNAKPQNQEEQEEYEKLFTETLYDISNN